MRGTLIQRGRDAEKVTQIGNLLESGIGNAGYNLTRTQETHPILNAKPQRCKDRKGFINAEKQRRRDAEFKSL